MKKKKLEAIEKDVSVTCYNCSGKGCKKCTNGNYKESHYIFITNGMAIDSDTLK
jgi:hypothetical protein